jgi:hypothetical protein
VKGVIRVAVVTAGSGSAFEFFDAEVFDTEEDISREDKCPICARER